jgi:hypothetical protein
VPGELLNGERDRDRDSFIKIKRLKKMVENDSLPFFILKIDV